MDIEIPFDFPENLRNFLRRCGYQELSDINNGTTSYKRRLTGDYYPRFHLYPKLEDGRNLLSLHLDQKKPSYPGAHAHSAEYDGSVVSDEAARIAGLIKNILDNHSHSSLR
ncbi:MAG: hypothetical protein A3A24_03890 [Candidatus Buchananbacteria bacterium RIFCSPLOWO2_01_FULL_46_12]|uniref:Uncharacterized protein n=2 Tax=Candidatus Buchananiibacteriota TaxID=1817903 RepID=A0A1G1YQH5_9BACT|nr:MAG: hypothetical protein A2744_03665 [Candidatus Buchananbacteria bacterium RIFCSPHIGHO2_01_FULL_44_11]OGY53890.1 MAG: hypothetical protein A3A24_03890 [Candidatus Buchananbacteria bacterium RIFCSPLOWO2_01_FULL_46_12]